MKKLEFHPLAELLPMMPEGELAELAEDIKANGQKEQIVLLDGKIIEGRSRYLACGIAKVKPDCRTYQRSTDGNDPVAFVLTHNVFRRHLTSSQRAICLAELRNRQKPAGSNGSLSKAHECASLDSLAKSSGVSPRTMDSASKVVQQAAAPVIEAVKAGDVSLKDAAAVADLPKAEQKAALKEVKSGKAKTLKAAAAPKPKQGKQKSDPRAWTDWEADFGKLKRRTDEMNKLMPAEKFCRQAQDKLNEVLNIINDWKRAVR